MKANIAISKKEKFFFFLITAVLITASAMYVGERFQPYGIAGDIASYATARIDNQPVHKAVYRYVGEAPRTHTVRKGDTVWGIAKKHGVHLEELKFINELPSDGRIVIGQRLIIPDKG